MPVTQSPHYVSTADVIYAALNKTTHILYNASAYECRVSFAILPFMLSESHYGCSVVTT